MTEGRKERKKGLSGRLHFRPTQMIEPSAFVAVMRNELQMNLQAVGHAAAPQEVGLWRGLSGCDADLLGNWFPTFRGHQVVSSSRVEVS